MSKLIVKSLCPIYVNINEKGKFVGVVSTEHIDRHNDIVISDGIEYTLPLQILFEHKNENRIGEAHNAYVKTIDGVNAFVIEGQLDLVERVKSNISIQEREDIRKQVKKGILQWSIGFLSHPSDEYINKNGTRVIKKCYLQEVSIVKAPANINTYTPEMKSFQEKAYTTFNTVTENVLIQDNNKICEEYLNQVKTTTKRKEFVEGITNLISLGYFGRASHNSTSKQMDLFNDFQKRCQKKAKEMQYMNSEIGMSFGDILRVASENKKNTEKEKQEMEIEIKKLLGLK